MYCITNKRIRINRYRTSIFSGTAVYPTIFLVFFLSLEIFSLSPCVLGSYKMLSETSFALIKIMGLE